MTSPPPMNKNIDDGEDEDADFDEDKEEWKSNPMSEGNFKDSSIGTDS